MIFSCLVISVKCLFVFLGLPIELIMTKHAKQARDGWGGVRFEGKRGKEK